MPQSTSPSSHHKQHFTNYEGILKLHNLCKDTGGGRRGGRAGGAAVGASAKRKMQQLGQHQSREESDASPPTKRMATAGDLDLYWVDEDPVSATTPLSDGDVRESDEEDGSH
jgi:hypothetical protein